ncbi:MAG TPA: beta-ketoacyl synthase N-terminal-like domain-containing protein, partial [Polyangia bacterium]
MSTRDQIVVVGMGAASALGTGCAAMAAALVEGRDGIRPVDRFETAGLSSGWAGTWPAWDGRKQTPVTEGTALDAGAANFSAAALAHPALTEALAQARLDPMAEGRRMALLLGTCFGDGFTRFAALTEALADAFGIAGPRLTFCTACSSSTNAIGHARDLLNAGVVDVAVAGGVDVLLREGFAGFNALGVLSAAKCAPFGTPAGTTLGEGAGFIVLMRAQDARQRGCQVIASIDGSGLSADAHHETAPDPSGAGIERAVRAALLDAGVTGTEIDHVNAHATGTDSNDATEWAAIARALASRPPASGLKSYLAHGMGAAGVLELILALVAMRKGLLPATLRALPPRLGAPPDPVPQVR